MGGSILDAAPRTKLIGELDAVCLHRHAEHHERGFLERFDRAAFIGVNVQDVDADAQAFLRKYGVTYANGSKDAGPISIQYGMRGVPETYFIAPDGRLIRKWNTLTAADLEQFLAELQRASAARAS